MAALASYLLGVAGAAFFVLVYDWGVWSRMDASMGVPQVPWRWRHRRVSPWVLMGSVGLACFWSDGRFKDPPPLQAGLAVAVLVAIMVWWFICIYRDIRGD